MHKCKQEQYYIISHAVECVDYVLRLSSPYP